MESLTKMTGKPCLQILISRLALYLEVIKQMKIHFHFQAGRGCGVHPLRGEAGEVRHDHAVLWILWRSHEAFRKVASHDYLTENKPEHI